MCSCFEHIEDALFGDEGIRHLLLPKTIEENRKVVVKIELLNLDFPGETVGHSSMIYLYGKVTSLVESDALRW